MKFFKLLKKFGILILIVLSPLNTLAQTFSDLPQYYKYYKSVSALSDGGIINGYNDGSFKPEQTISRAEATKLIIASQNSAQYINDTIENLYFGKTTISFPDVYLDDWYAPYIAIAEKNGVVKGYPDRNFKPNNQINFAEGLKIILGGYNIDSNGLTISNNQLLYVNNGDWFAQYFAYAYNKNLINRAKFYHPAQIMTRGEFAEILYRLKAIQAQNLTAFSPVAIQYSDEYTITIPTLNIINLKVTFADLYNEKKALETLKNGLGHYMNPPGEGKKVVIFGHSSGYSWDNSVYKQALRQINNLQSGDMIYLNYQEKGYVYQIASYDIVVASGLKSILTNYNYEELALYTCWPPDSTRQRYVVYAERI